MKMQKPKIKQSVRRQKKREKTKSSHDRHCRHIRVIIPECPSPSRPFFPFVFQISCIESRKNLSEPFALIPALSHRMVWCDKRKGHCAGIFPERNGPITPLPPFLFVS
ncbi:hypothetical protein VTH06DRAFT_1686 [Thermothelomyces fergusii]